MKKKYFCSDCKGLRNHIELKFHEEFGSIDNDFLRWSSRYSIIECQGCDNISFLYTYGDETMVEIGNQGKEIYHTDDFIYPFCLKQGAEINEKQYLPESIKQIYTETINAIKAESYILAAGGFRAIIESICNYLKISQGSLEQRINKLHNNGHLSKGESNRLHSIRFLGNDALHEIKTPKENHIYILLDITNHLLENLFINDKKLEYIAETIVDTPEKLINLIHSIIRKEHIGKEYTLKEFLGKSYRLLEKTKIESLELDFFLQLKENKIEVAEITASDAKKFKILNEDPYKLPF